jgi:hypothetical protein
MDKPSHDELRAKARDTLKKLSGLFEDEELATFRRKIDVFGSTVNGFGRAKTAGLPAVFFEGFGSERATCVTAFPWRGQY